MVLVFLGPPGSGKGTQASLLSIKMNISCFSIGDILRSRSYSQLEGIKLKELMSQGKLVSSDIVNGLLSDILTDNKDKMIVLDGYPRSLEQAVFLSKVINKDYLVFFFYIDHKPLLKRLTGRFSCSNCGKIYNKFYHVPNNAGVCDNCHCSKFEVRQDDNEETVKLRLKIYKKETLPLIDFYKKTNKLITIDATKEPDLIFNDIREVLKNY